LSADANALHRFVAKVENLEGPEEELVTRLTNQIAFAADLLSGHRRRCARFHLSVCCVTVDFTSSSVRVVEITKILT
jgi:hypothetical protein